MKQTKVRREHDLLTHADRRQQLLRERPAVLGASWARESCEDVTSSGRRIEGGWPGTVPEARTRVQRHITDELASGGLEPMSQAELATATSIVMERAKRDWQLAAKGPGVRISSPPTGAHAAPSNQRNR